MMLVVYWRRTLSLQICGVSVLRAGETMEPALSEVFKDIRLGKILIQTNLDTGEPEVRRNLYLCHWSFQCGRMQRHVCVCLLKLSTFQGSLNLSKNKLLNQHAQYIVTFIVFIQLLYWHNLWSSSLAEPYVIRPSPSWPKQLLIDDFCLWYAS